MSHSHYDYPTGGLPPAYIGTHKIPDIGETRCYWALLSSNLQFLYMDPVLVYHLQDQAKTLYGKSLLMFIHPDDRRVAEGDLQDCLSDAVQHGSVTRVRFQRLSRVRRELGHERQVSLWPEASKIALDPNYMAVDIVINWAADGLVLCFMHAVQDLTPSDNDKYHKTPWTNWCGNVGLDNTRLDELVSRLERCAPEMPLSSVEGITKVFQILRNEPSNAHRPDRGLLITWPPDSPVLHHHNHPRRGYGQVATARDLAGISNEMQAGLAADTDARTNCTKRTQTTRDLPLGRVESVLVGYGPILFACHKIIMHHAPSSSSMSSSSSSSPSSYAPSSATYGAPQPPPPPLPPPSEHALILPPPHPYHHDEAPPLHGSGGGGGGGHYQAHHSRGYTTGPGVMTPPTQARHPSDYPVPIPWHQQQQQQQHQQHSEPPPQSQSRFSNQSQASWAAAGPSGAGYSSSQSQHMRSFRVSIGVNMYGSAGSESGGTNAMVTDDPAPSAPSPTSHHSAAAGAGVPYERGLQQHPHRYQNRPSDEQPPSHAMVPAAAHHHHHHHHHHHQQQQQQQQLQYSSIQAPPAVPTLPPPSALAPLPPSTSLPPVHTQNQTRKRSPASPTLDGPGVPTSRRRTDSEGGYGGASAGSQPTSSSSPGTSGAGNVIGQAPEAPPPLPSRSGSGGTSSGGVNDGSGGGGGSGGRTVSGMQCAHCKTTSSPEWRKGPSGKKELCNACGLRFARSKAKSNGATAQNGAGKKRKAAAGGGGGMSVSAPPPPPPPPPPVSGVTMKQDPSLDLPLPAPSLLHHHHHHHHQQQQQQGLGPALPPLDDPHIIHSHHQQPQPQHNHQQVRRRGSSFYSNEDSVPAYAAGSVATTSSSSYLPSPHEYHHQPQHHQHPSHTRHSLSPRLLPPPPSVPSSASSEHYYYALPPPSHHQHPQHHREYSSYRLDGEGEGTQYHGTPLSTSYERESRSGSGGSEREDGRLSAST